MSSSTRYHRYLIREFGYDPTDARNILSNKKSIFAFFRARYFSNNNKAGMVQQIMLKTRIWTHHVRDLDSEEHPNYTKVLRNYGYMNLIRFCQEHEEELRLYFL
jgi:hypothetical protein